MQHNVEFKGFDLADSSRRTLDRQIAHLEKRAETFPAAFLRLAIDKTAAGYHLSLVAELPQKTLAAKHQAADLNRGIRVVFRELTSQLQDYKSSIRREHLWKRLARRDELREMKHRQPDHEGGTFFDAVNPHLRSVFEFVGHELRYAEAMGDLAPGEIAAEEVVDGALIHAYQEFGRKRAPGDIQSWLIHLATEQIDSAIRQSGAKRGAVAIEEDLPRTPPEQWVSWLGEEIFSFYQPDDRLKVEDTVPDDEARSPEEEAEREETRRSLASALAGMSRELRRLMYLRHVQGMSVDALARMNAQPADRVKRQIEEGREYLRRKLIEARCVTSRDLRDQT